MSKQLEQQLIKASAEEKKAWVKQWKADPKKNPVDGKGVVKGKGTYIMLVEHLGDPEKTDKPKSTKSKSTEFEKTLSPETSNPKVHESKLKPDLLYIGDNGVVFCGNLKCAGQSAYFNGYCTSGLKVTRKGISDDDECERCGKTNKKQVNVKSDVLSDKDEKQVNVKSDVLSDKDEKHVLTFVFEYRRGKPIELTRKIRKGDYAAFYGIVEGFFRDPLIDDGDAINKVYPGLELVDENFCDLFDEPFKVDGVETLSEHRYKIRWFT